MSAAQNRDHDEPVKVALAEKDAVELAEQLPGDADRIGHVVRLEKRGGESCMNVLQCRLSLRERTFFRGAKDDTQALFASLFREGAAKRSFADVRSQAELGNDYLGFRYSFGRAKKRCTAARCCGKITLAFPRRASRAAF